MRTTVFATGLAAALLTLAAPGAHAQLVNLGPGSFTPAATTITFSEVTLGTTDPVYVFGSQTVSFGELFQGQAVGGSPSTLTDSSPTGPLTLIQNGRTFTAGDGSNPTAPILSGTPYGNGPISIQFSTPVAAVGLDGGFFDAVGSTTIEAYDSNGASLGTITNSQTGIEFYGLFDAGGSNIAGISFYITGAEPAGFAIDNVTFGDAEVVIRTPEPASLAVLGMALAGLAAARRRRG